MLRIISGRLHFTGRLAFVVVLITTFLLMLGTSNQFHSAVAAPASAATVTIPNMKLPWDKSLTNIPFTGGPHSGKSQTPCVLESISGLSGVDFGLKSGTNVLAVAAGTVFLAKAVSDSRGPYIVGIDHGGNFATEYWHLSSIASSIKVGVSVTQGTTLAKSGAPVGGPAHLHLEFRTGSPGYLTSLSAHNMPIDGYLIWAYINTANGNGYNYQGTMTRSTTLNKSISACGATGVKTWYSQSGPTIIADANGTGGYLISTNSSTQSGGAITEFPIPTGSSQPRGITKGPDGNLWFVEEAGNKMGKTTTSGSVTEYPITSNSCPNDLTAGADGNLWFTEGCSNKIGKTTTSGSVTEFAVPTANSGLGGITAGADGNLWFTEGPGSQIGKITISGAITEYPVPTGGSDPSTITAGPDSNLWFTENVANKIGKITTSGSVTEYSIPIGSPTDITKGPDGNLWFTEIQGNKIGKITTSGTVTAYSVPTSNCTPYGITAGTDGNLWFTEESGNKIGKITP